MWLPFPDSLRFDWQVPREAALEHWFIDKGAGTPTPVGTHNNSLKDGYDWVGTSSTYAHSEDGSPQEVIPWILVQDAAQP